MEMYERLMSKPEFKAIYANHITEVAKRLCLNVSGELAFIKEEEFGLSISHTREPQFSKSLALSFQSPTKQDLF